MQWKSAERALRQIVTQGIRIRGHLKKRIGWKFILYRRENNLETLILNLQNP